MATKQGRDVTQQLLADARRGADARPAVEALKEAIAEVAHTPLGFPDAVALAAARQPGWRASEQLALAEQAVWEMLHQGRVQLCEDGNPLPRERWQPIVLRWATWAGLAGEAITLRAP
jgi:hypothetical protein